MMGFSTIALADGAVEPRGGTGQMMASGAGGL
jgi:hypothetical protein